MEPYSILRMFFFTELLPEFLSYLHTDFIKMLFSALF